MKGNRAYKDSVFTLLFQDKKKLLELYNAIEGTHYTEETELEINTLEKALYMDRANDISFLLDGRFIVLLEHQSTLNENMPLRCLLYIARLYEKIIDANAIYKEKLIPIPTPEFIVLYNGTEDSPEEMTLQLSDAFMEQDLPNMLELRVKAININYDKSAEILKKSKTLREYSYFVYQVRYYKKQGMILEEAIEKAMTSCINQGILKEFLETNGSEVINMLFTEFNLETAKKVWQEESRLQGKAEGRTEGKAEGLHEMQIRIALNLFDILSLEQISEKTGLSVEELKELRKED